MRLFRPSGVPPWAVRGASSRPTSTVDLAKLKTSHKRYFRSASVDFTFTDADGKPLLSIEFDGIGGGFGHGRRYVPARPTPDPNREWKMNFKLRATARAGF